MANTPFTPDHTPLLHYDLCWHPVCTHITWRERATPLPEGASPDTIPAPPRYLPMGTAFCSKCELVQNQPGLDTARLIGSMWARRITAIGFGVHRKEQLKAQRFQWGIVSGVWVYTAEPFEIEKHLASLSKVLGSKAEISDVRTVPLLLETIQPLPTPPESTRAIEAASTISPILPEEGIITSLRPGISITLTPEFAATHPIIARLPWPPSLRDLAAARNAGPPPEVARTLVIPSVRELTELGFSQSDLWQLMIAAAAMDIAVCTGRQEIHSRPYMAALKVLPELCARLKVLPQGPGSAISKPSPTSSPNPKSKSKGGRPPSARVRKDEVLALSNDGMTAAEISRTLSISSRSVRRIICGSSGLPSAANQTTRS